MGNTFPFPGEAWMPWKECSVMDERLRFVAWLLDGEAMSEVCRAFGISRKTGYKIFERYKDGTPVSHSYEPPFTFTGTIEKVTVVAYRWDQALGVTREPKPAGHDRHPVEQH